MIHCSSSILFFSPLLSLHSIIQRFSYHSGLLLPLKLINLTYMSFLKLLIKISTEKEDKSCWTLEAPSQVNMNTSVNSFGGCFAYKLPVLPKSSLVNLCRVCLGTHSFKGVSTIVPSYWSATFLTHVSPFCTTEYFDLVLCLAEIKLRYLDNTVLAAFSSTICNTKKEIKLVCCDSFLMDSLRGPRIHSLSPVIVRSGVFLRVSSSFIIYSLKNLKVFTYLKSETSLSFFIHWAIFTFPTTS